MSIAWSQSRDHGRSGTPAFWSAPYADQAARATKALLKPEDRLALDVCGEDVALEVVG